MQLTHLSDTNFAAITFRGALLQDLARAGVSVTVLTPDWSAVARSSVEAWGCRTGFMPMARTGINPLSDLQTLFYLWQYFRQHKPQVVFSRAAKPNVWGMLAARLAGVPHRVAMVEGLGFAFTHDADGALSIKKRLVGAVLSALYRLAFACAHKVMVLNPDDASDLARHCGLPAYKTVMVGAIGLDLDEWPAHPPHLEPLTFTLVARMLREKGVFEFLQAAQRVKVRYPQVRFQLLGGLDSNPGSVSAADLQPWVEQGIVHWPGKVDVKPYLAETSVFVLPSYREGVPRSTQEAMAMGRPVISTDVPGCRETVLDGVNGFLVPPRNVDALVHAMERFIAEPALVARMGAESRRLAEERFDVRVANQIQMDVLLNNLASNPTPKAA